MMSECVVQKADLGVLLRILGLEHDLFGPKREGGRVVYGPLSSAGDLVFDFSETELSVKEFFFPQTEVMMRFDDRPIFRPVEELTRDRAVLNVRPCDARAMALLDKVFCQDRVSSDPYWRDRRERTLLLGLACDAPCESCFCLAVGGGPFGSEGLDILAVDLGERLLLRAVSPRGGVVLARLDSVTEPPRNEDLILAGAMRQRAVTRLSENPMGLVPHEALDEASMNTVYGLPLWERLAGACLNCGVCTFCCPTCHCFDIQDEAKGMGPDRGRRLRNWDSCMSWLFTQHASGHNPRGTKTHRVRQRFMHKFVYMPIRYAGLIGCVGCGRCVTQCPVNIDIRQVVAEMNAGAGA